jgi:hypothetical protein
MPQIGAIAALLSTFPRGKPSFLLLARAINGTIMTLNFLMGCLAIKVKR